MGVRTGEPVNKRDLTVASHEGHPFLRGYPLPRGRLEPRLSALLLAYSRVGAASTQPPPFLLSSSLFPLAHACAPARTPVRFGRSRGREAPRPSLLSLSSLMHALACARPLPPSPPLPVATAAPQASLLPRASVTHAVLFGLTEHSARRNLWSSAASTTQSQSALRTRRCITCSISSWAYPYHSQLRWI